VFGRFQERLGPLSGPQAEADDGFPWRAGEDGGRPETNSTRVPDSCRWISSQLVRQPIDRPRSGSAALRLARLPVSFVGHPVPSSPGR